MGNTLYNSVDWVINTFTINPIKDGVYHIGREDSRHILDEAVRMYHSTLNNETERCIRGGR